MSLFKFGFTPHSDKDNEEEQKADRKQNKNMKKESKNTVFFPNGKMILNGLRLHIKHTSHTKEYKLSGKQMKTWKPLDKDIKDYLYQVIDSSVKAVSSKPLYNKEEEVQDLLSQLQKKLKVSLDKIKVPKRKVGKFRELRQAATDLREEYENLTTQQLEVEKEIRQEERMIEALEDGYEIEDLVFEVPEDVLGLPKMVFGQS